jgi:hypothetical protein
VVPGLSNFDHNSAPRVILRDTQQAKMGGWLASRESLLAGLSQPASVFLSKQSARENTLDTALQFTL